MTSPIGNIYIERRTLSVPCYCGAKVNEPCVNRMDGGRTLSEPHPSRIRRIEGRLSSTERLHDAYRALEAAAREWLAALDAMRDLTTHHDDQWQVAARTGAAELQARAALAALDAIRKPQDGKTGRARL